MEIIIPKYNYWIAVVLMMIGLYGVISKKNLIKKVIGLVIFQTSIILFYVSIGVKAEGAIPIVDPYAHKAAYVGDHHTEPKIQTSHYANPLPHVLMLTAIVVGVGTLGVALAVIERIFQTYGSTEEDVVLEQMVR